jgi:tellurite resistance protein
MLGLPFPDTIGKGLMGYGLLQALILARLLPWIMAQAFAASYWAFSFGLSAIAFDAMVFVERRARGTFPFLAAVLFTIANAGIAAMALGSIRLLVHGRILPASAQTATH